MPTSQLLARFQELIQFEVLRRMEQSTDLSQRVLAKELYISLGSYLCEDDIVRFEDIYGKH